MADLKSHFLAQLDEVIAMYGQVKSYIEAHSKNRNAYTIEKSYDVRRFNVAALAAIDRIVGADSTYGQLAHGRAQADQIWYALDLISVIEALRNDVAADYVTSVTELIHADVFSDFLEMADYLLKEGYKDPAAVLGGGVLEEHLRQLCTKHGVPITDPAGKPKKASTMNTDLAKQGVYALLEQQQVTAWLAVRNDAAHGNYSAYGVDQVRLLIQGIRDFIIRHSA